MKKQECKRCLNNSTVKNIKFDDEGICNYCRSYEKIAEQLHDYKSLEANFLERVNRERGKHQYDVAMGFSGGKDSTYVLYKLVKEYQLKVKAYTLDNGFLSAEAKTKIDQIVKEIGVEHEYVECDQRLLYDVYRYIVSKYLSPCIACSYLGYAVMINYSSKIDAAVGVHGRSTLQMLRGYTEEFDDTFKPFILAGLDNINNVNLEELYRVSLKKISCLIDSKLAQKIEDELLYDAKKKGYRDFIAYFLYHPYDKDEVVSFITKNTSWKVETSVEHFDCQIHNAALYIKNIIARRPHLMNELSVAVRERLLTKDEALLIMNQTKISYPKEEMKILSKKTNLNRHWLLIKARVYGFRWW